MTDRSTLFHTQYEIIRVDKAYGVSQEISDGVPR